MEDAPLTFELNRMQTELMQSTAKETLAIAGIGSGKSFGLGAKSYQLLSQYPGGVFGLGAPTISQLASATFKQVSDAWAQFGFMEGYHYVVNERPPKIWGIDIYSKLLSTRIVTTVWGSYLIMFSLDNFNPVRGIEFDALLVDEWRDVKIEARKVLLGRLRGKLFAELGIKTQIYYATTPPDNPTEIIKLRDNKKLDLNFITGSTHLNEHNLDSEYIPTLLSTYDDVTYRREVMGELVMSADKPFAYAFSKDKHVSDKPGVALFDPERPVYLSFDFNVDPATCLAFQSDFQEVTVIQEFHIKNADIYELCGFIRARYPESYFYLTGDSTGKNRQGATKGLTNYYKIIREELLISDGRYDTPGKNMAIRDSRMLINSILQNFPSLQIGKDCELTIKDLQLMGMTPDFKLDKTDPEMGHLLDCFRYYFHTYHYDFIKQATRLRNDNLE